MTQSGRRVVHVIAPEHAGGGAESVIAALSAADPDHTLVVALNQLAAADDPPHPFPASVRARGVDAREIRCGRRRYVAEARELSELLAREGATHVHSHGYHGDVVAWLATRTRRLPRISTVHGYIRRNLKEHLFNVVDRAVLRRFDAVIAVSAAIRDQLVAAGMKPDRVHVVENGLASAMPLPREAARARLQLRADALVCGWVGRLSPEKGPDLFVEAYSDDAVPGTAVLIGEGPERAAVTAMAVAAGLDVETRLRMAGFQADAAALLPAFDVLALTSRTEGTPMVLLEAINAGVPIVAFAVGGVPALLDPDCAWLVPPGDVDALRRALRTALTDRAEASARAARARVRVGERLSMDRWLERQHAVYARAAVMAQGKGAYSS